MISKIENNVTVPSVAALVKVARALGTSISSLLEQDAWLSTVLTTKEKAAENTTVTEKGYSIYPFASDYHDKKMQPFLFSAKRGEVKPHLLSHEGEEFIYIIRGEMKMQVGAVEVKDRSQPDLRSFFSDTALKIFSSWVYNNGLYVSWLARVQSLSNFGAA
ncbi:XRE family transcriptional regulator [Flammeovirgaceae bacterium 311]|nr:XRE family transcriptional regulator [Flammeovirgaceae bacterium 311]